MGTIKVSDAALQNLLRAYHSKQAGATGSAKGGDAAAGGTSKSDEITISSEAQGLQRAIQAAQQTADVRAERVAEIQAKLQGGNYLLDPQAIANKMLGVNGGGQ